MSYMFEVYYKAPVDLTREQEITGLVTRHGGSLDYRETSDDAGTNLAVCLTYEFPELESARAAADVLRQRGDHVEGPVGYGP